MTSTHAVAALAAAILTLPVTTRHAPASSVLVLAFFGGAVPDIDLVTNHRKTLHFPVYLPVVAVACLGAYGVVGHQSLFLLAVGLAGAGLHSVTDVFGGGLGYEPWTGESTKAVYNHALGRWHEPRGLVRYAGAPEDFLLAIAVGVPALAHPATDGLFALTLVVVLVGSGLYAATRRRFTSIAAGLRARLPAGVVDRLPEIRFEDG